MRGPFERLKYDLQRQWECPVCKRRERTSGAVTFRHCLCQMKQVDGQPVVMKLIADHVQRVTPPIVIHHEPLSPMSEAASMDADQSPAQAPGPDIIPSPE